MASTSSSVSTFTPLNDEEQCIICLQGILDRTLLPECGHNYTCFLCICTWISSGSETLKVRRCPLCNTPIGNYIVHNVRGEHDFQRHWLPPTAPEINVGQSPTLSRILGRSVFTNQSRNRHRRNVYWGRRSVWVHNELDELERAIERRRHIYRTDLYAKVESLIMVFRPWRLFSTRDFMIQHVASNRHTRYRPSPTPAQITSSQELCSRILKFVRRELRVWEGLDVEVCVFPELPSWQTELDR
jgi:Zinc finger, C3HC4 type (RING finger)